MMCSPYDATLYLKYQGGGVRAYAVEYRVSGIHDQRNSEHDCS